MWHAIIIEFPPSFMFNYVSIVYVRIESVIKSPTIQAINCSNICWSVVLILENKSNFILNLSNDYLFRLKEWQNLNEIMSDK